MKNDKSKYIHIENMTHMNIRNQFTRDASWTVKLWQTFYYFWTIMNQLLATNQIMYPKYDLLKSNKVK